MLRGITSGNKTKKAKRVTEAEKEMLREKMEIFVTDLEKHKILIFLMKIWGFSWKFGNQC